MKRRFNDSIELEIVEKYKTNNYNCAELGKEYLADTSLINKILRRHNIPINNNRSQLQRKYKFNENYFDEINTEIKAYYYGLILSDGFHNENRNLLQLELSTEDRYILERFNKEIESERPILDRKQILRKDSSRLSLSSKILSQRLLALGCMQRKSFKVEFPNESQCPFILIRHFIRGFFDGNGTVYHYISNKSKFKYGVKIVSTNNFLKSLTVAIDRNITIKSYINQCKDQIDTNVYYWEPSASRTSCIHFLEWLYKDANIFLTRKFNKFNEIKQNLLLL